ncbi:MAG: amidase family protein, partial [Alkalispirochaeta sp.]
MSYDLRTIDAPRIEGSRLLFLAWILERHGTGRLAAPSFLSRLGVESFRATRFREAPRWYPLVPPKDRPSVGEEETALPEFDILKEIGTTRRPEESFVFPSMADYARGYHDGSLSPLKVAERIIHVLERQDRGNPPLYAFISWNAGEIRRQAEDSAERIANGSARSVLEGVPIAIKDELDIEGFPTSLGTSFLTIDSADVDAALVARLRAAGAMIIGKTNMHE